MALREAGSIPDVGSSSITTCTSEMSAGQERHSSARDLLWIQKPRAPSVHAVVLSGGVSKQHSCSGALGNRAQRCPLSWQCSCLLLVATSLAHNR